MLLAMLLSIAFIILDILSVTDALKSSLPVGINPFWKLAFTFKCLTDAVVLDDFKTALDRLSAYKISTLGSFGSDETNVRLRQNPNSTSWNDGQALEARPSPLTSPDCDRIPAILPMQQVSAKTDRVEGLGNGLHMHRSRNRDSGRYGDVSSMDHGPIEEANAHILWPQASRVRGSNDSEYGNAIREITRGLDDNNH